MKYTDPSKTMIALGNGIFVPVDQNNRDYRTQITAMLAAGETIADHDPAPPQPVSADEKIAELEAKILVLEAKAEPVK